MLKKAIYLFTAFCLLNATFCFNAGEFQGGISRPGLAETDPGSGTLLDFLIQQFQDDDDGESKSPVKAKCRHNFFYARSLALSIQAPVLAISGAIFFLRSAPVVYANYLIRKASLPSYYNFLFRLKPF